MVKPEAIFRNPPRPHTGNQRWQALRTRTYTKNKQNSLLFSSFFWCGWGGEARGERGGPFKYLKTALTRGAIN